MKDKIHKLLGPFLRTGIPLFLFVALVGCENSFEEEDIQTNPNAVTEVELETLMPGTMLGVAFLHEDTDVRIVSLWTGHINGLARAHQGYSQYLVSSQNFLWSTLYPVASQARLIQIKADELDDTWTKGVGQVLEALIITKATSLWGDVPYSQAFEPEEFPNPQFDAQSDVYAQLHTTLEEAIENLSAESGIAFGDSDFLYQGDVTKWIAAAHTLKARLYLHTGDYADAIAEAELGITGNDSDLLVPHGNSQGIDTNLNYDFFRVTRAGDVGYEGAYFPVLLQSRIDSENSKTDETALYDHYVEVGATATGSLDPNTTDGAFIATAPHPILTYYENQLIMAEAQARSGNLDASLSALNSVRNGLASGYINGTSFPEDGRQYEEYTLADFGPNGTANSENFPNNQEALLYEIISQRYICLMMQYESFNDYRRLDVAEPTVQLPIPLNAGDQRPERLIYPEQEINTNPNVPKPVPDQFTKMPIYQ
ncbi:MAG: SusD/RagB family nutrient-binding outer membrane lipoprotein [Pricia sp.]